MVRLEMPIPTPLTLDQLLTLRLVNTVDGIILMLADNGDYVPIGQTNDPYKFLFASSALQFQALYQSQKVIEAFLENADRKHDLALTNMLTDICASLDAVIKITQKGC